MVRFEVTLKDATVEIVEGATAYAQEGQLTTFFRTDPQRGDVLDSWSTRVASIRTGEIVMVRRHELAGSHAAAVELAERRTA